MSMKIKVKVPREPYAPMYAIVDDEDYEWLSHFTWYANVHGYTVYAMRKKMQTPPGESRRMHKMITGYVKTDHKNRIGLDNRRENLREATHGQNMANAIKRPGTSSKFKGVNWVNKYPKTTEGWVARIQYQDERLYLGKFKTELDAAKAYDEKALELFGEFARLNFPK